MGACTVRARFGLAMIIACHGIQVLDRCLALEEETSQIPGLRRQLDSYRRAKTDAEVASREQVSLIFKKCDCDVAE